MNLCNKEYLRVVILWGASFASAAITFLTQFLIAKYSDPASFGVFTASLAVVSILIPLGVFGIPQYWFLLYGKEGWGGSDKFILTEKLTLFFSSGSVILLLVYFFYSSTNLFGGNIFLLVPYMIGQIFIESVFAKYQLEERYIDVAIWQVVPTFFRLLSIGFVVVFSVSVELFLTCVLVAYALSGFFIFVLYYINIKKMKRGTWDLKGHGESYKKSMLVGEPDIYPLLSAIWPFAAANFLYLSYSQIGLPMIRHYLGDHEAGIFAVTVIIISGAVLIPGVFYQRYFLPKMHRWAYQDIEKLLKVHSFGSIGMLAVGVFLAVAIAFSSDFILSIFGDKYSSASNLLKWYSLYIPLAFLGSSYGSMLTALGCLKLRVFAMLICALLTIALNFILIVPFGSIGAIFSQVVSNFIMLLIFHFSVQRVLKNKINKGSV